MVNLKILTIISLNSINNELLYDNIKSKLKFNRMEIFILVFKEILINNHKNLNMHRISKLFYFSILIFSILSMVLIIL